MEENKGIMGEDGSSLSNLENTPEASNTVEERSAPEVNAAEEQAPCGVACEQPEATQQEAERAQEQDGEELEAPTEVTKPLSWDFGKKKQGSAKAFFAVFGAVFGACVLMLIATLFLGDGFNIIKTLYTERVIFVREDDGTSGLLTPNEAADVVKKSTVTIVATSDTGRGIGSGFVYDENGHIVTNRHVIDGALTFQVVLPDGNAIPATLVGADEIADIAVLKVEAEGLVPVALGSSADLLVGDDVVAVGTPAEIDFAGTATFGKVSATRRLLALYDSDGTVYRKITVIQTDTSVNPGNSGGPMADMYGKVVGIVVRKIINYGGQSFEGIGFAIPIDGAKVIVDAIIKDGVFTGDNPLAEGRSLLGITGHGGLAGMWYRSNGDGSVSSSKTQQEGYYQMPADGVYVMEASSANVLGKLQVGDVIVAVDGLYVSAITDIVEQINRHYAGESVTVRILRDGTELEVEVRLNEGAVS